MQGRYFFDFIICLFLYVLSVNILSQSICKNDFALSFLIHSMPRFIGNSINNNQKIQIRSECLCARSKYTADKEISTTTEPSRRQLIIEWRGEWRTRRLRLRTTSLLSWLIAFLRAAESHCQSRVLLTFANCTWTRRSLFRFGDNRQQVKPVLTYAQWNELRGLSCAAR